MPSIVQKCGKATQHEACSGCEDERMVGLSIQYAVCNPIWADSVQVFTDCLSAGSNLQQHDT